MHVSCAGYVLIRNIIIGTAALAALGAGAAAQSVDYAAIIAAPDRTDADRQDRRAARSFKLLASQALRRA